MLLLTRTEIRAIVRIDTLAYQNIDAPSTYNYKYYQKLIILTVLITNILTVIS